MPALRSAVKAGVERILVALHNAGLARGPGSAQLVLAYHNIVPRGQPAVGDLSLHLPQDVFSAQLDLLTEHADVVSLERLLAGPNGGLRPRVAITWDDAYQGAVTVGVEELRRRNLPGTMFVAPGCLDGFAFWWDALADPARGLAGEVRTAALEEGAGLTTRVRAMAAAHGWTWREMPSYARTATEAEVRDAAGNGLTLGAHTWNHPNLTRLTPDERRDELLRPLAWLGAAGLPSLAYPYGLWNPAVAREAADAGYRAGFLIDGGWWAGTREDGFKIPRLNVPAGLSRDGFTLRLYGRFAR
ncbi:MAG: polysaccharide deacetylase family protein [Gemmatimonadota bacterium]